MKSNRPTRQSRSTPFVRPSIVFSPNLIDGINAMADAVKPTLGPLPRQVGIERIERGRMPELLDDAGLIARRIIQLEDPTADVGAMMLRHGMWRMHERIGDGAATMAVLTQAMMREAVKGVAAGMHPMWLRRGIERGAQAAVEELRRNARPLAAGQAGRAQLSALAYALSADKELMDAIVSIVNNIGSEGAVDVIINERRSIDYEFIEGALYNAGWISGAFVTDKARTIARQEDVAVILLQGSIDSAEQAVETIRQLAELGVERVALIAHGISEDAQQAFTQVHLQGTLQFILIQAPSVDEERLTALHDISTLTSARVLFDIGELMRLRVEDIGFARRLWATAKKFGIIAGRSDGEMLRGRAETVRAAITTFSDKKNWEQLDKLRWRLAQLTGGIAVLQVGALTRALADTRRDHAKRLIQVLQYTVGDGLVVGGGAAYIACRTAVEQAAAQTDNADERYGVRCVAQALTAPLGVLAHNAGYDSSPVISSVKQAESGHGFDARSGQIVNLWDAGIVDALLVVERALQTAASVTAMAITTDAVIHQRKAYPGVPTP